jgi:hypothetical protein
LAGGIAPAKVVRAAGTTDYIISLKINFIEDFYIANPNTKTNKSSVFKQVPNPRRTRKIRAHADYCFSTDFQPLVINMAP